MISHNQIRYNIIEGINKKEEKAYKYLYKQYYSSLCSYVYKMIDSSEEAEDIVQEVILAIYEGEHQFASISELTNYLYKACYNNALILIRNKNCHSNILALLKEDENEEDEHIYALTVREELIRQLYHYINQLPQEQRRIILLRIKGYSWNEIAEILGVSINTVKTHKSRSFKFLRKKLECYPCIILLYLIL